MVDFLITLAAMLAATGFLLALWRFFQGPSDADRVVAFDTLTAPALAPSPSRLAEVKARCSACGSAVKSARTAARRSRRCYSVHRTGLPQRVPTCATMCRKCSGQHGRRPPAHALHRPRVQAGWTKPL